MILVIDESTQDENEVIIVEVPEMPETPVTQKPTSTHRPDEPTEGTDVVSSGEPCSGHFQPHPGDCNAYDVCEHGQWLERHCAEGLHWNSDRLHCDWPANARCSVGDHKPGN